MFFRYAGEDGKLIPWSDLNFDSGAKITGEIPTIDKIITTPILGGLTLADIFSSKSVPSEWFDREACGDIVDISKWNGDIIWPRMWQRSDGVIGRCGYGLVTDQRFTNSTVPGFKIDASEGKYKAIYHYMNTGVSVSNQIYQVLTSLDALDEDVHAFWSDVEHAYNDSSSPNFRNFPEQIMRAVRQERPELKIGLYTNYPGFVDMGSPVELMEEFLFWYAWYPFSHELSHPPKAPPGLEISDIYMWQYWADGNGMGSYYGCASNSIDMNVTRDQTAEFLYENLHQHNEEGEVTVPVEDKLAQLQNEQALLLTATKAHTDKMIEISVDISESGVLYEAVTTAPLNVRTGPGAMYPKVDTLVLGTEVEVFEEKPGGTYTWAKISLSEEKWVATNWLAKENA